MVSTRPCTATCVIDGMPLTLTFYPDNGVLRIAEPSGVCIKETRWHASWRALLDEFRGFAENAPVDGIAVDSLLDRLGEPASAATRAREAVRAPQMALA